MGAMDKVADGIFVGSLHTLSSPRDLQKNNITHIISLLRDNVKDMSLAGFTQLSVQVDDDDEEDIMQYFEATNSFIDQARSTGAGVLVHCIAGISRSVTVVCAYLLYSQAKLKSASTVGPNNEITDKSKSIVDSTIAQIKKHRPIANPNPSFRQQLQIYVDCNYDISLDKPLYRTWIEQKQDLGIPLTGAKLFIPEGVKSPVRETPPVKYIVGGEAPELWSETKARYNFKSILDF